MCEKIGRDFAQHRNTVTKLGVVKEYWCKYGKKKGFACPVKIKIIEKGNKVYFYDEKEPKECNHVETSQKGMKRTYENYNEEETEAIKEAILEGEIPNDHQASYDYMLQKGKELGLKIL